MIGGTGFGWRAEGGPIATDTRRATPVEIMKAPRSRLADACATMRRDEREKERDARHERPTSKRRAARQGEEPRGADDGNDKGRESGGGEQLTTPMRVSCLGLELSGSGLVPGRDFAIVARDQDLSSFSD